VDAARGSAKIIITRLQERMNRLLAEYNELTGNRYQLAYRAGILRLDPKSTSSIEDLIDKANDVMKKQKEEGVEPAGEVVGLSSMMHNQEQVNTAELMLLPIWRGL
jgi:GGDEF domain-containing protein